MSAKRPKIPDDVVNPLMVDNHRTCCICHEPGHQLQIHHIDGDRTNNDPANLAVLCLRCHGRVEGDEGLGRAFTPQEVRAHKQSWEQTVRNRRTAGLREGKPIGWWRRHVGGKVGEILVPLEPLICDGCGIDVQFRRIHRVTAMVEGEDPVSGQFCPPCARERKLASTWQPPDAPDDSDNPSVEEYVMGRLRENLGAAVEHDRRLIEIGVKSVGYSLGGGVLIPLMTIGAESLVSGPEIRLRQLPLARLQDHLLVDTIVERIVEHLRVRGDTATS